MIIKNKKEILSHLTGMSSIRWGNGPAIDGTFKLADYSPRHKGDDRFIIEAPVEIVLEVIRENLNEVWPYYRNQLKKWEKEINS